MPELEHVTLCLLTGYTPSEADCRRPDRGAIDHYFVKPVKIEELLEMFKTVAR